MELSNGLRQVEEIEKLQDDWYCNAIAIKTPALFERLQNRVRRSRKNCILDVKKCLSFHILCSVAYPNSLLSKLTLEIEFPLDYPSHSTCNVKVMNLDDPADSLNLYNEAIQNYMKDFCGCECVELLLDFLVENIDSLDKRRNSENIDCEEKGREGMVQCYVLRFNHLLSGAEHKKEKTMLDTAKKSKLQGALFWGTPGIVLIVSPSSEDDAKEFASQCRTIGKRPDGIQQYWLPSSGLEKAGIGGCSKLQELDTAGLRLACGGREDILRTVLGLQ